MTISRDVAILMADLSGYTAATEIHGSASALSIIQTYLRIADECLVGRSSILERVGDQIVIVSDTADDVGSTALSLVSKCYQEANFLPIHVGLHFGSVLQSEGSFFGTAVNLAARIASEANAGEILCSEAFINNLMHKNEVAFSEFRTLKFKNILHPIAVALLTGGGTNPPGKIDPVCKMNVGDQTTHKAEHTGTKYYFCSEECMTLFERNPELFTAN